MSRALAALLALLLALPLRAQEFDFQAPPAPEHERTPAAMQDLAQRMLPVFQEKDPERYLANLGALQLVAGNPAAAQETRAALRDRRKGADARLVEPRVLFHDLHTRARALEKAEPLPLTEACRRAYRERVPALDDRSAWLFAELLSRPPPAARQALLDAFGRVRQRVDMTQAMDLIWKYLAYEAYRGCAPVVAGLAAEERERRYLVDEALRIPLPDGVELAARRVQPKSAHAGLPTLLEFDIDADAGDEALAAAAHGYVGLTAYVRGRHGSGGRALPFRQDAEDLRAVIAWIARQPWSDGRVALYGTRYSGFSAWAAAKHAPAGLAAIAVTDPMAPGIDFPREGGVMFNGALRWAEERALRPEPAAPRDDAGWEAVDRQWFASGRPYRDLDRIARAPSSPFRLWLGHPSYDLWWQRMIPFREQFAQVEVPVLSVLRAATARQAGALYYFDEHLRHRPQAQHLLVAGVRDQRGDAASAEAGAPAATGAARALDLQALRFAFFDHVLRGAPRPAVLRDRVNLALAGTAAEWRHAPTLEALPQQRLRLHLDTAPGRSVRALLPSAPAATAAFEQAVVLGRKRASAPAPVEYVGEPLAAPLDVTGLLSGQLELRLNRMDVDLAISLYERLASGEQRELAAPYVFRASYARDRTRRQPLWAGRHQTVPFRVERLLGRRLQAGSRLVLAIGVNLRPDQQVNYGHWDDVSAESIAVARRPLKIRWYGGSYIDLPVRPVQAEKP